MKDKTKTFLIVLSLIAFIVVGVLLVIKIGDIGKTQSAVNKQYKITYNANGGYAVDKNGKKYYNWSENVTYGVNYKTKDNLYSRNGYVFVGWNEKKDGTGVDWTSWIDKDWKWTYNKNVTLYAQWKKGTTLIPDSEFHKCVISAINKQFGSQYGHTNAVSMATLAKLENLNCSYEVTSQDTKNVITYSVKNITGIEYMKSLRTLSISNSNIVKLDLSKNTKLTSLTLKNLDKITTLNLTKNTSLKELKLASLNLKSLNLGKNTKLINLSINTDYNMASLNLTKNVALKNLTLNTIPIKSLDLSKNTKLVSIKLYYLNNLKSLIIPSSISKNNVQITNCPNVKLNTANYIKVTHNAQVAGNGYLGDNISGTSLMCRKDFVQFNISSAVNSTIRKVEYSTDAKTWKAFSSKNLTYKNGGAILKIYNSQNHIMFRVTDRAGNIQTTTAYGICINK